MTNILRVADACFANCGNIQDRLFYQSNAKRESRCHAGEMDTANEQHTGSKMVSKKKHLMEIYSEMQKHFQTLNSDLLSSTKENGRKRFKSLFDFTV